MENLLVKIKTIFNSSNTKNFSIILLMIVIALGYIFFFNSTKIFGENYDYTISIPGEVMTLENKHTVKLTRSDIDMQHNYVEYEFYFQNSNYDGFDNYNVDIKTTNRTGKITLLKTETICSDYDVYVVRAMLPKSWTAIVADITLNKNDNVTLEAKFYSDADSLYKTTIKGNTRDYFLKLDINRNIEKLNKEIISLKDENTDLEIKISEIEKKMKSLEERMIYMTTDELNEAETNVNSMASEKESCLKQIDDNKKLISEYTDSISDLKKKL